MPIDNAIKLASPQMRQGLEAYRRVKQRAASITPSSSSHSIDQQAMNILRAGDKIDIVRAKDEAKFDNIVNSILAPQIQKINAAEQSAVQSIQDIKNADTLSTAASINQAILALETITALRDKVINAYQEIMRMPL